MSSDSPIAKAILRYYPDWDPPADTHEWNKTLCPFHGESTPSAAISYDLQGFNCMACSVRGDVISIIRHEEEVTFAEAKRIAEELGRVETNPRVGRSVRNIKSRKGKGSIANRKTPWS